MNNRVVEGAALMADRIEALERQLAEAREWAEEARKRGNKYQVRASKAENLIEMANYARDKARQECAEARAELAILGEKEA